MTFTSSLSNKKEIIKIRKKNELVKGKIISPVGYLHIYKNKKSLPQRGMLIILTSKYFTYSCF